MEIIVFPYFIGDSETLLDCLRSGKYEVYALELMMRLNRIILLRLRKIIDPSFSLLGSVNLLQEVMWSKTVLVYCFLGFFKSVD